MRDRVIASLLVICWLGLPGCDTGGDACLRFELLDASATPPSNVMLFFGVETCDGQPKPGLEAEQFVIQEDGQPVSLFESQQTILPQSTGFELFSVLLLDMSGSIIASGNLQSLQDAATAFIDHLEGDREVAIYLFDGREELQQLVPFTSDAQSLKDGISSLDDYNVVDVSTNLNGAVVNGLDLLDGKAAASDAVLTAGSLVLFTDGTDQAGRMSSDAAKNAAAQTEHSVFTIGLGGEVDKAYLAAIGQAGHEWASNTGGIAAAFEQTAERISAQSSRFYVLGYCSPKRAGSHTLTLSVEGSAGSLSYDFNATGFEPGCDPSSMASNKPGCSRIKIDFLWVIDNSVSMCEEQVELARNFDTFVSALGQLDIDPRLAVTTADMQCDPGMEGLTTSQGVFNTDYATSFPPSCQAKVRIPCVDDSDCDATTGEPGQWRCAKAQTTTCMVTPNGSVISSCIRTCQSDADCQQYFGDTDYICAQPPSGPGGCVLPPQTAGCPSELPPVLTAETLQLFPCLATVGVNQYGCFDYEQGLRAAWSALDPSPSNPNAVQAQSFLRDDAHLVIVFVSDEDDCSVAPEAGNAISEDYYDTCAVMLEDSDNGGPLVPVSQYVSNFRSLKEDPATVQVAVIAGDGLGIGPPHVDIPAVRSCRDSADDACANELPAQCLALAPECAGLDPPECQDLEPPEKDDCITAATIACVDDNFAAESCRDEAIWACEDAAQLECALQAAKEFFCQDPAAPDCDPAGVTDAETLRAWERQLYTLAKGDPRTCYQQSYICNADTGTADWGRRYQELVEGFGDNGVFTNICAPEGLSTALETIAQHVTSTVQAYCSGGGR